MHYAQKRLFHNQLHWRPYCVRQTRGRNRSFRFWQNLIQKLGLVISVEKLFAPQNCIPCLGINVNIETGIISIPGAKLTEIIALCKAWNQKTRAYKRELQSLIGSLLYIHKCVRPARLFRIEYWQHSGKPLKAAPLPYHKKSKGTYLGSMPFCRTLMAECTLTNTQNPQ